MQRLQAWVRSIWDFILYKLLRADDPPHKLALGMAIGIFWTFTPTIGLQTILVLFSAWLLRANKAVGLPVVWISNFATMIPIFYICYEIGRLATWETPVPASWWMELANPDVAEGFFSVMQFYWGKLYSILVPLWIGSLIVATVTGTMAYVITYYGIIFYRIRIWGSLVAPTDDSEDETSDDDESNDPENPANIESKPTEANQSEPEDSSRVGNEV